MASSAGPAHRIMSDLSAFIGHRDPATHRILAAGDLNMCYGATGGTLSLPTRARRRRRSRPVAACAADQVAGGGAAAVVKEAGRHAGRLTGGAPRRAPAADGDAVAVEDQRAVGVAARPSARQGLGNRVRNGEDPPHQRLRARGREPDDAARLVDLFPGEAEDLVLAPAGVGVLRTRLAPVSRATPPDVALATRQVTPIRRTRRS